jgi:alkylation response protein AidB-like acyl-CoA dehydrogenase
MVPRANAEIVDDWFVSGLRGTGSKDDPHHRARLRARAPLDARCGRRLRRFRYGGTVHELGATQVRLAESAAEVDAAATMCRARIAEHIARGASGEPFSLQERVRYRLTQAYVARLCVSAVNRLFDAAGGNALHDDNPMQRMHRDVNAGAHQIALSWDDNATLFGRVKMGLEPVGVLW